MSILINLISVLLVYFYLPPADAGLPRLVTDATVLGVLNAIVLVAAAGRFTDAVTDPLIALRSDRSRHPKGRRIPFMAVGAVPAAVATVLLFVPPIGRESGWNIVWLLVVEVALYLSLTAYATPAFSLVADLGATAEERLDLATWTTVAWSVGIIVGATTPAVASLFMRGGHEPIRAWQLAVLIECSIALVAMLVPVFVIDEADLARSEPSHFGFRDSLRTVLGNPFFRHYLAAEAAYFTGLAIIQTGILYYVTVLLELDEAVTAPLLLLMVVAALACYPTVNRLAKRRAAKPMVVLAFVIAAVDFAIVAFLGTLPLPTWVQAMVVMVVFSIPFAILSVLPQWILSDIAEHAALTSGTATTGMFFAARTFLQKLAQTLGVVVFAALTAFGRDVGDDLGIRLSGAAGVVLYLLAAVLFSRYDEDLLRRRLAQLCTPYGI
jgi:glycoside/pentoside/hexuronide:cation symporter, GPH family